MVAKDATCGASAATRRHSVAGRARIAFAGGPPAPRRGRRDRRVVRAVWVLRVLLRGVRGAPAARRVASLPRTMCSPLLRVVKSCAANGRGWWLGATCRTAPEAFAGIVPPTVLFSGKLGTVTSSAAALAAEPLPAESASAADGCAAGCRRGHRRFCSPAGILVARGHRRRIHRGLLLRRRGDSGGGAACRGGRPRLDSLAWSTPGSYPVSATRSIGGGRRGYRGEGHVVGWRQKMRPALPGSDHQSLNLVRRGL